VKRLAKIKVAGIIIPNNYKWLYDWFEYDSTCPKDIETALEAANGEDIEVVINSGGGDVFAGSEIYTALKSYKGNVTIRIVSLAASAASVIAMAGNKILMSPTAQMMIHNVSSSQAGDYRDMDHMSEVLKNANETIANAYRLKTGMEQKDLLKLMDKETWFTAQQALDISIFWKKPEFMKPG
jgi:ATP-dependent protease ClpP protease subunit